jgi:hypothetical protein
VLPTGQVAAPLLNSFPSQAVCPQFADVMPGVSVIRLKTTATYNLAAS